MTTDELKAIFTPLKIIKRQTGQVKLTVYYGLPDGKMQMDQPNVETPQDRQIARRSIAVLAKRLNAVVVLIAYEAIIVVRDGTGGSEGGKPSLVLEVAHPSYTQFSYVTMVGAAPDLTFSPIREAPDMPPAWASEVFHEPARTR